MDDEELHFDLEATSPADPSPTPATSAEGNDAAHSDIASAEVFLREDHLVAPAPDDGVDTVIDWEPGVSGHLFETDRYDPGSEEAGQDSSLLALPAGLFESPGADTAPEPIAPVVLESAPSPVSATPEEPSAEPVEKRRSAPPAVDDSATTLGSDGAEDDAILGLHSGLFPDGTSDVGTSPPLAVGLEEGLFTAVDPSRGADPDDGELGSEPRGVAAAATPSAQRLFDFARRRRTRSSARVAAVWVAASLCLGLVVALGQGSDGRRQIESAVPRTTVGSVARPSRAARPPLVSAAVTQEIGVPGPDMPGPDVGPGQQPAPTEAPAGARRSVGAPPATPADTSAGSPAPGARAPSGPTAPAERPASRPPAPAPPGPEMAPAPEQSDPERRDRRSTTTAAPATTPTTQPPPPPTTEPWTEPAPTAPPKSPVITASPPIPPPPDTTVDRTPSPSVTAPARPCLDGDPPRLVPC